MTDIDFDAAAIWPLPFGLRDDGNALAAAATLPAPDTGPSTSEARTAIDLIAECADTLGTDMADLGQKVWGCIQVYRGVEDSIVMGMDLEMKVTL